MRNYVWIITLLFLSCSLPVHAKPVSQDYYVTSSSLNVRLAPNINGKATSVIYKRQKVTVFEMKDGWARVSRYYDGRVEGESRSVARWVFAKYLSKTRPKEETLNVDSPVARAIKSSDDFSRYQNVFVSVSEKLIKSGRCTLADFKDMGGWWKSTRHQPQPVYFTYCGGMHTSKRIYLNAKTKAIFK